VNDSSGRLSTTILALKLLSKYTKFSAYKITTIGYDGLDPHLPPHSTPHPITTNFSVYVPRGWLPLHSHVETDRRNPLAIVHTHSHLHNTAALPCSTRDRMKHGLPYPVGLKREAFHKNISTRTHTKLMEWLKGVTERRSCRPKN